MLFSSILFLFLFFPVVLVTYFFAPSFLKNTILLIVSLLFYAWGEIEMLWLMLFSIAINYLFGILIVRNRAHSKRLLIFSIAFNLILLIYYKYFNFLAENVGRFNVFNLESIKIDTIALPLGISFFTFHAISYLIDVYRGTAQVQKNPLRLALYISFFPQLVAGPIIRYHDIEFQLAKRKITLEQFTSGIQRFILGLGKKVLIANTLAVVADNVFDSHQYESLGAGAAWLGILCYTLQIYYDFSGYSDMAIGLGRMFRFEFMENFNFPYVSTSIKEFWRRWHISLSSWFRDYLYKPLGGSRLSQRRTYVNLLIVFFLCGLWHGASWNFVIWGVFHGVFLILERGWLGKVLTRFPITLSRMYTLLIVAFGWVIFRTENTQDCLNYYKAMAGFSDPSSYWSLSLLLTPELIITLAVGIVCCSSSVLRIFNSSGQFSWGYNGKVVVLKTSVQFILLLSTFIMSSMALASGTYNPFIYFRF